MILLPRSRYLYISAMRLLVFRNWSFPEHGSALDSHHTTFADVPWNSGGHRSGYSS